MQLRFSPHGEDDEDAYRVTRDALLDEFGSWLGGTEPDRAEAVGDVQLFLDWRHGYSTGVLDEFDDGDVAEFLLEWCPRKLSVPAEDAEGICRAVGAYVDFMARTDRLVGGLDRAAALTALTDDLIPAMREAMADPANFGMAKTLFAGLGDVLDLSEDELLRAVQARADQHNALPFEQRKALTDAFVNPMPELYELPFVHVRPPAADVDAAVAAAALPAKVDALRGYLGTGGKPLTDKGNLKLADGRALIELLDTGDEMDPRIGNRIFRTVSTAELGQLMFLVEVAKKTGAVRVHRRRLVAVKAWATRSALQRAGALFGAVLQLGPLCSRVYYRNAIFDQLDALLDGGIVHWMVLALGDDAGIPVDAAVDWAQDVVTQQVAPHWPDWPADRLAPFVRRDVSRIFAVLEMAGVLVWSDRTEEPTSYGDSYPTGGTFRLTALGRFILPDYLGAAGYALRRIDDLADGDGAALIDAMVSAAEIQHESIVAAWQPNRPVTERVRLLADAITAAPNARRRVMGFHALDLFDIDVAEPLVRQLLDSPVAGHAALWLVARGRSDIATLGSFVDTLVYVDLLAAVLDDPAELCDSFTRAPDPLELLDEMWRQPTPETALVLDSLGRHLPDPKLAKAARRAALRHRSWMANRK